MRMGWIILVVVYVVSAIVCAGWFNAKFQEGREGLGISIVLGLIYGFLGPLGVLIVYLMTGFGEHGWRIRL
jgi:hypothetical protein